MVLRKSLLIVDTIVSSLTLMGNISMIVYFSLTAIFFFRMSVNNQKRFERMMFRLVDPFAPGPIPMQQAVVTIARFRVELSRIIGTVLHLNASMLSLLTTLALAINLPDNLVMITELWLTVSLEGDEPMSYGTVVNIVMSMLQWCALGTCFTLMATMGDHVHRTSKIYVPLQARFGQRWGQRWLSRVKLSLMVMHEIVNSKRWITFEIAHFIPVNRRFMFEV